MILLFGKTGSLSVFHQKTCSPSSNCCSTFAVFVPLFYGELSPRSGTFSFKFEIECRTLQLGKISAWVAAQESEVGQTSSQRGIARGKPYQLYEMGSFFGRSLPRSSSEVVHLFLFPHDPPSFPPLFRVLKIETLFHD